jgi:hypothetical protein
VPKTLLPPYPCYSFSICVDLCKFDSLAFDQTSFNLLKKYHSLLFFLFELNNFNIDSVGVKLLQHIFREYKYILVIVIAFKVVSFILFLTFVLRCSLLRTLGQQHSYLLENNA